MGSSTYIGASHLKFRKLPLGKGAKLNIYKVINIKLDQEIGIIHWRGGWRQYVFQAEPEIDMSRSCHKQIDKFINELMRKWHKKHEKRHSNN